MLDDAKKFRRFTFYAAACAITLFLLTRQKSRFVALAMAEGIVTRYSPREVMSRLTQRYTPQEWSGEVTFTHWVHYVAPHDYTDLQARFGMSNVDGSFRQCDTYGMCHVLELNPIPSLAQVERKAGRWVTYQFYVADHPMSPEQSRAIIVARKRRPGLSEELIALSEVYGDGNSTAGTGIEVIAPGSEGLRCTDKRTAIVSLCVPVVAQLRYNGNDGVSLETSPVSELKPTGTRYLMVVE